MRVIIFDAGEEGVDVMYPAPQSGLTIEQVAEKDVPAGSAWRIVNFLPSEPQEQWGWTASGPLRILPPKVPTKEQQELNRQEAYVAEADPLFFKWQAGEVTKEVWLAKRAEIESRYPYPEE